MNLLGGICTMFHTSLALWLALYHELEEDIPDDDNYNLGYFEGKQQKWLVS